MIKVIKYDNMGIEQLAYMFEESEMDCAEFMKNLSMFAVAHGYHSSTVLEAHAQLVAEAKEEEDWNSPPDNL